MTDFETHPVGTAARIEQLEAALTRANAATAAAYEVAANVLDDEIDMARIAFPQAVPILAADRKTIRALATPDQTAALDKLIAEAVKPYVEALQQIADQTDGVTPEPDNLQMAIGSINSFTRAILAASKKGGA